MLLKLHFKWEFQPIDIDTHKQGTFFQNQGTFFLFLKEGRVNLSPPASCVPEFICELSEAFQNISFIEHLWEIAYFRYKLQYFNQQI